MKMAGDGCLWAVRQRHSLAAPTLSQSGAYLKKVVSILWSMVPNTMAGMSRTCTHGCSVRKDQQKLPHCLASTHAGHKQLWG